ncbi:hypothetical protein DMUE_3831 [Dictyocoela muelleri]|nr:hypothetical protein DMUE_3831 [Dictyocoela muelleri]
MINIAILGSHRSSCLSDHNLKNKQNIRSEYKDQVKSLHASGMTRPREIHRFLNSDFTDVCIKDVYNIIANEKKRMKSIRNSFTLAELTELSESNTFINETEPYVIAYETNPVRILFTQQKLLFNLGMSSNVHIDATYKLTIYCYSVIIVGISDSNRKFFCSAICIAEYENQDTYSWI